MTTSTNLTTSEASALLGISGATLRKWRITGGGPRYHKLGRAVRYSPHDLADFLAKAMRASTSDPGPGMEPAAEAVSS